MSDFTVETLENGIVNCRNNITVLEDAIEAERVTIKNYRVMIDDIETAERNLAAAEKNIVIEVVND